MVSYIDALVTTKCNYWFEISIAIVFISRNFCLNAICSKWESDESMSYPSKPLVKVALR